MSVLTLRAIDREGRGWWRRSAVQRFTRLRFAREYEGDPGRARSACLEHLDRIEARSELFVVLDRDAVVGSLALAPEEQSGGLLVADLALTDPALLDPAYADAVHDLVRTRALDDALPSISIAVHRDDAAAEAFVRAGDFAARATNMSLGDLGSVRSPARVRLRAMTAAEFARFTDGQIEEYAKDLRLSGATEQASLEASRRSFEALLPAGQASPDQHFLLACDDRAVGHIWLDLSRPMAFVYDLRIRADQQRRGYGAETMDAAAVWCHAQGSASLGLNVFAHNLGARALYDALGYAPTIDFVAEDLTDR